jgi:hypothetical protein
VGTWQKISTKPDDLENILGDGDSHYIGGDIVELAADRSMQEY